MPFVEQVIHFEFCVTFALTRTPCRPRSCSSLLWLSVGRMGHLFHCLIVIFTLLIIIVAIMIMVITDIIVQVMSHS